MFNQCPSGRTRLSCLAKGFATSLVEGFVCQLLIALHHKQCLGKCKRMSKTTWSTWSTWMCLKQQRLKVWTFSVELELWTSMNIYEHLWTSMNYIGYNIAMTYRSRKPALPSVTCEQHLAELYIVLHCAPHSRILTAPSLVEDPNCFSLHKRTS
jgi:hypothetical protein